MDAMFDHICLHWGGLGGQCRHIPAFHTENWSRRGSTGCSTVLGYTALLADEGILDHPLVKE